MGKWEELKQAVKNPPPDRLARIEYRSHALQAIGITFVSIMLIIKGLWYIIFAFIFGVGISYSQGMGAYRRYKAILEIMPPEKPKHYSKEISPSRRAEKIINYAFGSKLKYLLHLFSFLIALRFVPPTLSRISFSFYFVSAWIFSYLIMYVIAYKSAKHIYEREMMKGGDENARKKETKIKRRRSIRRG